MTVGCMSMPGACHPASHAPPSSHHEAPRLVVFVRPLQEYHADVVVHFGMHGTVEWLPGAPLGNTGLSW